MFFKATDGRFKRFCTVLETKIRLERSKLEGPRAQGSKARGMKKEFSKVSHTTSKVKSVQSTLSHLITTSITRAMFTHFLVEHGLSQYY